MCLKALGQGNTCQWKRPFTGNDESEIHEPAEDEFEIFEAIDNVSESDAAFAGGATLVLFKPCFDVGAFVFLEPGDSGVSFYVHCRLDEWGSVSLPLRLFRKVWYQKV